MGCSDHCSDELNINRSELNINKSDSPMNGWKLRPLMPRPPKSDLFSFHDHLATKHEQSRPEISTAASVTSSRWNPTPEQLRVLEELYGGGTRTPTADQIKLIAGKLRRFGKIEGKNVFYWFQNHKARERQKRRRHPEPGFEVDDDEQGKKKPSSKCSTITEESVSVHRAVASEITTDEWIQLDERELQQRRRSRSTQSNHTTWQLMKPSSTPDQLKFMYTTTMRFLPNCRDMNVTEFEEESGKPARTLQLFPIRSGVEERENEVSMASGDSTSFSPNEFFEFLPLKN